MQRFSEAKGGIGPVARMMLPGTVNDGQWCTVERSRRHQPAKTRGRRHPTGALPGLAVGLMEAVAEPMAPQDPLNNHLALLRIILSTDSSPHGITHF